MLHAVSSKHGLLNFKGSATHEKSEQKAQRFSRRLRRKKRKRAGPFSLAFADGDGSQGFSAAPSKNSPLLPLRVPSAQERQATAVVHRSGLRCSPAFLCVLCVKAFSFSAEGQNI
jgi:hypothetical protein